MSSKKIYGKYFFNSTVNEEKYLRMLKFFLTEISERGSHVVLLSTSPRRYKKTSKTDLKKDRLIDKKIWPPGHYGPKLNLTK